MVPTIAKGDYVQVNYLGQIWNTAKVFDNSYDRKRPPGPPLGAGQRHPRAGTRGLVGKKVGSRVELAIPPAWGYGKKGQPQAGIKGTDTLVFVVDIEGTFNAEELRQGQRGRAEQRRPAEGRHQHRRQGPVHRRSPRGRARRSWSPSTSSRATAPRSRPTAALLVQYKGVLWDGGKEFDSTYRRGRAGDVLARSRS